MFSLFVLPGNRGHMDLSFTGNGMIILIGQAIGECFLPKFIKRTQEQSQTLGILHSLSGVSYRALFSYPDVARTCIDGV